MKKLLCSVVVLTMLFCLCGCGGAAKNTSSGVTPADPTENEKAAAAGKIPELSFALGDDPDEIITFYEEQDPTSQPEEEIDRYFEVIRGQNSVTIAAGSQTYYYERANKDKGVSVLCSSDQAYGFTVGVTTLQEVESSFSGSAQRLTATEDDQYFLIAPVEDCTILRYRYEDVKLDFYFSENVLIAAVLMNTANWTL